MQTDSRIDEKISKAAPFARPILEKLRSLVHEGCPEVTETIKWGYPAFEYYGMLCNMASFKQHVTFGFWKTSLLDDPKNYLGSKDDAAGSLGRITRLEDLPPDDVLLDFIRQAARLNQENIKKPAPAKKEKAPLEIPAYFMEAISTDAKALEQFDKFSQSHKREYVEWIAEAKTEATREKRLAQAMEWMAEGKSRNWKYERK